MENFRKTRESKREERKEEEELLAGQSRQTRMEDFFRVNRTRSLVREKQYYLYSSLRMTLLS